MTVATGTAGAGLTVRLTDAVFPSVEALISVEPGATPVTNPSNETVATAVLLLVQANVRVKPCPSTFVASADNRTVAPVSTLDGAPTITTLATLVADGPEASKPPRQAASAVRVAMVVARRTIFRMRSLMSE